MQSTRAVRIAEDAYTRPGCWTINATPRGPSGVFLDDGRRCMFYEAHELPGCEGCARGARTRNLGLVLPERTPIHHLSAFDPRRERLNGSEPDTQQ